jgi:uncharacterized protein
MKKATISLDSDLVDAARARAAETDRQASDVIEAALRAYLSHDHPPTLAGLRARREELLAVAQAHGASSLRIFGSVARGDARPDSDVDFLVELEPGRNLLDLSGLILDLQDALGHEVDVVEISKPSRTAGRILEEAVPL